MGVDLSKLSDDELSAIVSGGSKTAPKKSVSDMSDEELSAVVAGGKPNGGTPKVPMGKMESFLRGVLHGGAFGYEDEIANKVMPQTLSGLVTGEKPGDGLKKKQEQASQENPYYLNTIGELVGGVASPMITTAGLTAAAGAAPEIAGIAALTAAASKLKYIPKAVQAARAARAANAARAVAIKAGAPVVNAIQEVPLAGRALEFAGRTANAAGQGAGYSALAASGDAEEGQRLEAAKSAAPSGAAFGVGLHGVGELITSGTKIAQRVFDAFRPDQTRRAQRDFQKLLPQGVEAETSSIPGMPTLPKGDEAKGILQNLSPERYAARVAEQEAALRNAPRPAGEISAPTVSGVTTFERNLEAAKNANKDAKTTYDKDVSAAAEDAAAKKAAIKNQINAAKDKAEEDAKAAFKQETGKAATGPAASNSINKASASTGLKLELEHAKEIERQVQADAWTAAAPEKVPFNTGPLTLPGQTAPTTGTLASAVFRRMTNTETDTLGNAIIKDIERLGSDPAAPPTLLDVQAITSDLNTIRSKALGLEKPDLTTARAAKKMRDAIVAESRGRIPQQDYDAWLANIKGTKDFYKKWTPPDAPPEVNGIFKDGSAASRPSTAIEQFTKSKEGIDHLVKLSDSSTADRASIVAYLRQWLGHDLSEKVGEDLGSKSTVPQWINSNSYIFERFPELKADFGNLGKANASVRKVLSETSAKTRAKEIKAAQDAILPREVAEPNLVDMPEKNRFLPSNPTDPKQIYAKMNEVLRDRDPNSMNSFMDAVGKSDDSINGAKRIVTDMITDPKARGGDYPTAHDFIDNNREKLDHLFTTKEDKELLDMFSEGSKMVSASKSVEGKAPEKDAGGQLLGAALMAGLKTKIGYYPARMAVGAVNILHGIPNESKKKLIEDALLDPNGATAKLLKTEVTTANFPRIQKSLDALIPGVASLSSEKEKPTPRYSSGGAVYTPPAISSIRADRARRSAGK